MAQMKWRSGYIIIALILVVVSAAAWARLTRHTYPARIGENCRAPKLEMADLGPGPHHLKERLSADLLPFAVASAQVYSQSPADHSATMFALSDIVPGWRTLESEAFVDPRSGLAARSYVRDVSDGLDVLIAFRGSAELAKDPSLQNLLDVRDSWRANLLFVTGWFDNDDNQYLAAETYFSKVRALADKMANSKRVSFYTTGHSLGGGLAQHIALSFDCVAAVVFDSSPITGESFLINHPRTDADIVDFWQLNDPVGTLANYFNDLRGIYQRSHFRAFYQNLIDPPKIPGDPPLHSIDMLAISMAREAICCRKRDSQRCKGITGDCDDKCSLNDADVVPAARLFCGRYAPYVAAPKHLDVKNNPACKSEPEEEKDNDDCVFEKKPKAAVNLPPLQ